MEKSGKRRTEQHEMIRGEEPKRDLTTLEYIILGIISVEPQSGYSIISYFELGAFRGSASPGSVYPILKRLEAQGIITGELEMVYETRPRKMYKPTELGCSLLDTWLTTPITKQDVAENSDTMMQKFLFMEKRLTTAQVLAWLDEYQHMTENYLILLDLQRSPQLDAWSPHMYLIIEFSLMGLHAQQQWIQLARERLSKGA